MTIQNQQKSLAFFFRRPECTSVFIQDFFLFLVLSSSLSFLTLPRKEVIQGHLPVPLPCYDFVPVINPTFDGSLLSVKIPASGVANSHDVTGGVYKARERIQRSIADLRLLATPSSCRRVAACNLNWQSELGLVLEDSLRIAPSLPIVPAIVACV